MKQLQTWEAVRNPLLLSIQTGREKCSVTELYFSVTPCNAVREHGKESERLVARSIEQRRFVRV